MSASRTKIITALFIAGFSAPVWAQDAASTAPDTRDARFINVPPASAAPAFSGLASPPQIIAPATQITPPPVTQAADLGQKVDAAPLADVSPESVGLSGTGSLGVDMWKGTPRSVAEILLSIAAPTGSPVLNDLARRLLTTAAVPPDGTPDLPQQLTSLRVAKLVAFADAGAAWSLAAHADAKAVDDTTFHQAAEAVLIGDGDEICAKLPVYAHDRAGVDWQKALAICQMRAKDTQAAQVSLDVLRAQTARDDIFLQVADKNVLGSSKTLPNQLTPLTPALLGVLRLTGLPLPGEIYSHPDYALVPVLLAAPAKQDVAQLGLAERAAARGMIDDVQLATVYKSIVFAPDVLASPLSSAESGARLRALLYQASIAEKDAQKRISYAVKFIQSAPPELLNGAGGVLVAMIGGVKADPLLATNAQTVTQIYMLANDTADAATWYALVKRDFANADFQTLWPQFVLAGLEPDNDYAADSGKWMDAMLAQSDARVAHNTVAASLLLFDAAGYIVPATTWAKVLTPMHSEKHISLSPILLERLRAAGIAEHRAEVVLLGVALAGDGDLSLPVAVDITRALRLVGLKNEAAAFARQSLAILTKAN